MNDQPPKKCGGSGGPDLHQIAPDEYATDLKRCGIAVGHRPTHGYGDTNMAKKGTSWRDLGSSVQVDGGKGGSRVAGSEHDARRAVRRPLDVAKRLLTLKWARDDPNIMRTQWNVLDAAMEAYQAVLDNPNYVGKGMSDANLAKMVTEVKTTMANLQSHFDA